MTDIEMKIEVEEFTEELSDEALDREGDRMRWCGVPAGLCAGAPRSFRAL